MRVIMMLVATTMMMLELGLTWSRTRRRFDRGHQVAVLWYVNLGARCQVGRRNYLLTSD